MVNGCRAMTEQPSRLLYGPGPSVTHLPSRLNSHPRPVTICHSAETGGGGNGGGDGGGGSGGREGGGDDGGGSEGSSEGGIRGGIFAVLVTSQLKSMMEFMIVKPVQRWLVAEKKMRSTRRVSFDLLCTVFYSF